MKCPNCNETLLMTERQHVEIDYCPNCRGVWLDKGELDKLLEYASSQNPISSASPYEERPPVDRDRDYERSDRYGRGDYRDDREYNKRYPRKKKSFLSDFFYFD